MRIWNLRLPSVANKANTALIEVRAVSLNPIDYKKQSIPILKWGLPNTPVSQDFAGVILELGPVDDTCAFKVGDAVFGNADSCLAEKIVVSLGDIALKPKNVSFIEASSMPTVFLTSLQALRAGGCTTGSKVVVAGASGGCGSAGVMLARHLVGPDGKVVGICGTSGMEFCKQLACTDELLDYRTPETLFAEQSALNTLKPFDMVYDTVTSPDEGDAVNGQPYDAALRPYLRADGLVVAINGSAGRWIGALTGWQGAGYKLLLKARSQEQLREIAALVEQGVVRPIVDSVHAFTGEGASAAFDRLKSRRARGKVCVDVSNGTAV